jgi:Uma2 family endonuclease
MSDVAIAPDADLHLYSLHPEEDVVETPPHRHQVVYFETNLRAILPARFVGANLGVYWIRGQYQEPWVGPDVLVSQGRIENPPTRVYQVWMHGPISFVAEIASEKTRHAEQAKREQQYAVALQIPECLYLDLDRHQLELWRLTDGVYHRVPEENGRVRSQELGVEFGWDPYDEFVRIWTADGQMLLTKEEDLQEVEEVRATAARAIAAARAAEAQAAELAAELDRLRRAAGGGPGEAGECR